MADEWLHDAMLAELPVSARLRVSAAAREDLELLTELVKDGNLTPELVHFEDGHALAVLPGFRSSLPDHLYRMAPPGVAGRLSSLARLDRVLVEGGRLLVDVTVPAVGPSVAEALSARVEQAVPPSGPADGPASPDPEATVSMLAEAETRVGQSSSTVRLVVDLATLAAAGRGLWRVVLHGRVEGGTFDARVPPPKDEVVARVWHAGRPYRVRVAKVPGVKGLAVSVDLIPPREVASGVLRRVRRTRR